jgi:hypothetical protein
MLTMIRSAHRRMIENGDVLQLDGSKLKPNFKTHLVKHLEEHSMRPQLVPQTWIQGQEKEQLQTCLF